MRRIYSFLVLVLVISLITAFFGCDLLTNSKDDSTPDTPSSGTTSAIEVTNLSASIGSEQVTLTWDDPSGSAFDHCEVWYGPNGTADTQYTGTVDASGNTITGLINDTEYTFTVKTVDTSNNVSNGESTTATPTDSNLVSQVLSEDQINLGWVDKGDTKSGYRIERKTDSTPFTEIAVVNSTTYFYSDTNLEPNTTYYYRIIPYDISGDLGYFYSGGAATESLPQFTLTVVRSGGGHGTVESTDGNIHYDTTATANNITSYSYDKDTEVTLQAQAATVGGGDCEFTGWTGHDSLSGNDAVVTMDADKTVAANFAYSINWAIDVETIPAGTSTTGNYTVSWTTSSPLMSIPWSLVESTDPNFSSRSYYSTSYNESPYKYFFTDKPAGTYYYRIKQVTGDWSNTASITVSSPDTSTVVRVVNNSSYDIISCRMILDLPTYEYLSSPYAIYPGGDSLDFVVDIGGTLLNSRVYTQLGYYNDDGSRDTWFTGSHVTNMVTGEVHTVEVSNPTIGELLSNGDPNGRTYRGTYWVNTVPYMASFVFERDGTWTLYDDGQFYDSGTLILVEWPIYGSIVKFKLKPGGETILLPYPFGEFFLENGPSAWPVIQYTVAY